MNIQETLQDLTPDDITSILTHYGAEVTKENSKEIIFTSICHGSNSHKLYYYKDSHNFKCWSRCGNIGSLIDFLIHINSYEVKDAINEIKDFFHISSRPTLRRGFRRRKVYKKQTINDIEIELLPSPCKPFIHHLHKVLKIEEWEDEGISYETLKKFDIRYDLYNEQIIIPHFCPIENNRIVGIRVREMLPNKAELFGKYHPLYVNKNNYAHSLGKTLYGLSHTKENIRKYKKCIVAEGEKFVLQQDTMYPNTNISVSLCGSNMSLYQKKLLIDLGVEEILFALDKQYETEEEMEEWKNKITHMAQDLIESNVRCFMILDNINGLLDYKDAPTDKGKDVFDELVKNKIEIERIADDKI